MNPYLSAGFLAHALAGMGMFAWMGHLAFRRLARYYGADGLPPPPGSLRYLFRALLALWLFLLGALAAALWLRLAPQGLGVSGASLTMGGLGLLVAAYYLARGY